MTRRTALATIAVAIAAVVGLWFGVRAVVNSGNGPSPTSPTSFFGYNDRWPTLGSGSGAADNPFQLAADDGANVIRFVISWGTAQKYD